METLSVLPDGRIALCKMVHGTEITLVFQAKECPETLNGEVLFLMQRVIPPANTKYLEKVR